MRQFATKKKLIGDKVYLKTIEDEWVCPKRLTVSQNDELNVLQQKMLKDAGVTVPKIKEIEKIRSEETPEEEIPDSAYETLMSLNFAPSAEMVRFYLLNGIGKHSFVDDKEGSTEVTETLVDELMEYSDIAVEISKIVQEFNTPLAKTTSGTSETSQNGSTEDQNLKKETPSQTKESPQS
ncbi:MAG: hypothetical protein ACQ5SW_00865 [Sphaerochaetaceae bacterium]